MSRNILIAAGAVVATLPLLAGCATGELPDTARNCIDPERIQSITIGGSDDIVLPMIAGERHNLFVSVVLDGPTEAPVVKTACLGLYDSDFWGAKLLATGEVQIPPGESTTEPVNVFDLTCMTDQEVRGLNAFRPGGRNLTDEKKTTIYVQGTFGVKSNKVRVRCPDVVTTGLPDG